MRELIKKEQLVTIVPQDFKNTNKGKVLEVSQEGFRMELKYKPSGLIQNHICDFYSMTDNGYLHFESYIKELENNVISIANPVKHRFLQRRKFTRVKFIEPIELKYKDTVYKARTLDISAGGMKIQSEENINIEHEYSVVIKLSDEQEIKCKYSLIRVERGDNGLYTVSGRFTQLSNIDKMMLIQYCMQKEMENKNK
ncbi:MAG: PilZ domain-containing protein [bacterium]|nr:PilZ domain-containing protein [bacterium]